ncbi:hypothetical protein OPQ81_008715 [Rhizoctonia solani]|nr:hypothetical protein OPQ81_008715 [Rhizoctonia solani]
MSSLFKTLFGFETVRGARVNRIPNGGNEPPPPEVLGLVDHLPVEQEESEALVANDDNGATDGDLVGGEEPVPTIVDVNGDVQAIDNNGIAATIGNVTSLTAFDNMSADEINKFTRT